MNIQIRSEINYRDQIARMADQMDSQEDWGTSPKGFRFIIERANQILNEPGIEERSADEWNRLIMEGGDDWAPLQVAQSILEL